MTQDLIGAMAMEQEYRLLQTDNDAKTAFGYHDKLKAFGFNDTIEYENAKIDYYIKTTNWGILYINDMKNLPNAIRNAIVHQIETFMFVSVNTLTVFSGKDGQIDLDYCKTNKIDIIDMQAPGGAMVGGEYDLGIVVISSQRNLYERLLDKLIEEIKKDYPDTIKDRNDIIVNGYKVCGGGSGQNGEMRLYGYLISFIADINEINNISTKEIIKEPKGLSELGSLTREQLIGRVQLWLQQQ